MLITMAPSMGQQFNLSLDGLRHGYVSPMVTSFLGGSMGGNPVMGILMLLMASTMAFSYFTALEREHGSLRFGAWCCVCNVAVALPFLALSCVLSCIHPSLGTQACNGLWPLLLIAMTQQCLADPDRTMSFWGLVQIPGKWYPFALVGFFSLLSMQFQITLLVAVLVGVATSNAKGAQSPVACLQRVQLPLDRLLPSVEVALWVEQGADSGQRLQGNTPLPARIIGCIGQVLFMFGMACPSPMKEKYVGAGSIANFPKVSTGGYLDRSSEPQRFEAFQGSGQRLGEDEI